MSNDPTKDSIVVSMRWGRDANGNRVLEQLLRNPNGEETWVPVEHLGEETSDPFAETDCKPQTLRHEITTVLKKRVTVEDDVCAPGEVGPTLDDDYRRLRAMEAKLHALLIKLTNGGPGHLFKTAAFKNPLTKAVVMDLCDIVGGTWASVRDTLVKTDHLRSAPRARSAPPCPICGETRYCDCGKGPEHDFGDCEP